MYSYIYIYIYKETSHNRSDSVRFFQTHHVLSKGNNFKKVKFLGDTTIQKIIKAKTVKFF